MSEKINCGGFRIGDGLVLDKKTNTLSVDSAGDFGDLVIFDWDTCTADEVFAAYDSGKRVGVRKAKSNGDIWEAYSVEFNKYSEFINLEGGISNGIVASATIYRNGEKNGGPGSGHGIVSNLAFKKSGTTIATYHGSSYVAVDIPNVNPIDKTDTMTQAVGADADGKLWTEPGAGTFTVTLTTQDGIVFTPDKTFAEAYAAYAAGRPVKCVRAIDGIPLIMPLFIAVHNGFMLFGGCANGTLPDESYGGIRQPTAMLMADNTASVYVETLATEDQLPVVLDATVTAASETAITLTIPSGVSGIKGYYDAGRPVELHIPLDPPLVLSLAAVNNSMAMFAMSGTQDGDPMTGTAVFTTDPNDGAKSVGTFTIVALVTGLQFGDLEVELGQRIDSKLSLEGGRMSGALILNGDPADTLEAATKQYVDSKGLPAVTASDAGKVLKVSAEGKWVVDTIS